MPLPYMWYQNENSGLNSWPKYTKGNSILAVSAVLPSALVKMYPLKPPVWSFWGPVNTRSTKEGNFNEALSYYDASLRKQVISSTYLKKSRVEKYLYRWEESIADLNRYLELARLTNDRRKLTEQELKNLQFGKDSYQKFIGNGGILEVKKLPFSDHKMEYFPCITGDGKTLYYTARELDSMRTDENLFKGSKTCLLYTSPSPRD